MDLINQNQKACASYPRKSLVSRKAIQALVSSCRISQMSSLTANPTNAVLVLMHRFVPEKVKESRYEIDMETIVKVRHGLFISTDSICKMNHEFAFGLTDVVEKICLALLQKNAPVHCDESSVRTAGSLA